MPASALLKFVQGATIGGDGRALVGVIGSSVTISNVNNTGVQSWQIDLVYADPTSALVVSTPYASNDSSSTPSATFTPDVRRSYRWMLKVWSVANRVGQPDSIDIRQFGVRELNGALIAAPMIWPLPLPDPRTGEPTAKPLELNYDGQLDGWHGTGSDGFMNQLLARHMPPLPGNPGEVLTVVGGRWTSAAPAAGGTGDVTGPASSVTNNVVVFSDTTGKHIADSGLSLSAFIRKDGTVPFTGSQSMGGFKLTNLANGTVSTDAVNLGQLQAAVNGLDPKGNVRAYTTTNVASLSGLGAVAGSGIASFTDGQRIGLGGQTTGTQNGIWVVHSGAWTRPADFATGADASGAFFFVDQGTFADRGFLVQTDEGSAVVDTNNLTLIDFGNSSVTAGNGLQKIGNTLSVVADGPTLTVSVSGVKVSTGGITGNELAVASVDLSSNKVVNLLPFSNLANGAANSVLGRAGGTVGVMASIAASADGQVLRMAGGALGFGAIDLSDGDAVSGTLPLANLPSIVGLSVLGRASNTTGVVAAITGTTDLPLRVDGTGTTLAFGQLATGAYANNSVTLVKLPNASASSVLGRSAATSGVYADIVSSADGQVLRRGASGVIGWGAVDLSDADAVTNLLPFSNIANGAATSVLGRSAGTAGVMASIAAAVDGHVLQRVAGALVFAAVGAGGLAGGTAVGQVLTNAVGNVPTWGAVDLADSDAVTGLLPLANISNLAGLSVLGRSVATSGVMAAITGAADQVLVVNGAASSLAFGTVATGGITDGAVTLPKLANGTAASVLGRSGALAGPYADIVSSADGQVLTRSAGVIAWGAVNLADSDAVTGLLPFANLANGGATSVLARSANSVGVMAPLSASADGQILQRVAGALTWGALPPTSFTGGTAVGQVLTNAAGNVPTWGAVDLADADAVTGLLPIANIANLAGLSVLGRSANTTGVMAAITGADGQVLRVAGTALGFGAIVTAGITDGAVTLAKLANATASSVLGRSAATAGVYADIVSSADGQVLRRDVGGVVSWGAVNLADADAVTGKLPLANIVDGPATSVLARAAGTSGVFAALAAGADGVVLQRAAGVLTWATLPLAGLVGGTAQGQVLINGVGNVPVWGAVDLADVDAVTGLLPLANISNLAGLSLLGRAGSSSGVMAAITGTANQVLTVNSGGTSLVFSTLNTANYTDASVTPVKMGGGSAVGQVLINGALNVPTWGAVDLADADAVTGLLPFANLASLSSFSVLGRSANTAGVMAAIQATADGQVLRRIGSTSIAFGTIDGGTSITNTTITLAKLANGAASSVLGRSAATAGVYADIISSADGQVLRRGASGVIAWGALDLADADAVTGLLPGTNVDPAFGTRNISTSGYLTLGASSLPSLGIIRIPNNQAIYSTSSGGTNVPIAVVDNSNVIFFGSSVATDTSIRGSSLVALNVAGSNVITGSGTEVVLSASSGTLVHAKDLGSGRRVLGLLGTVTLTEMPANTGDGIVYIAKASSVPGSASPVNGVGIFVTDDGVFVKGPKGTITQLAAA